MKQHTATQFSPYIKLLTYGASIIALATLLTYGYTTIYYYGYFRAFDIDIHSVDFFPTIIDVVLWGIIASILLIISAVLYFLMTYIMTVIAKKIGTGLAIKYRCLQWLKPKAKDGPCGYNVISSVTVILVLALILVLHVSDRQGYQAGKEQTRFTAVVENSDLITVLIYQNDNTGIFRQYDKKRKTFSDNYSIESINNKMFRSISLDRE